MAKRSPKLIKICLENRGEDSETPWAEDLGPAKDAPKGSRKVRLVNVPFMHAKPTWGDVIVVSPVADGLPTWDSNNIAWSKIGTRILEDSGRFAMIVNFTPPSTDASGGVAFGALDKTCAALDIVCEGCYGPTDGRPGCVYLAVPGQLEPEDVMAVLDAVPAKLEQIHPEPPRKKRAGKQPKPVAKPAKKSPAKKPAANKPAAKPAANKPAANKPAANKPAAKKPAAKKSAKPAKKRAASARRHAKQ